MSIQYDDYPMTCSESPRRSSYDFSPEDATPQNTKYHVCSEYVFNVYNEAFSDIEGNKYLLKDKQNCLANTTKRMARMANNVNTNYYRENITIDYISGDFTKDENGNLIAISEIYLDANNYKEKIKNEILPGDIIVYRRSKIENGKQKIRSGHAVIYVGKGKVLNSIGGNYNYKTKKETSGTDTLYGGSIAIWDLEGDGNLSDKSLLSSSSGRALYSNVTEIAIIRPINEIVEEESNYKISYNALHRKEHNKLVRTKTASVEKYDSVNLGDKITYTISLENKSDKDYKDIKITDVIPENTDLVSISEDEIFVADVNKDGEVDFKDILQINKYRLGAIKEF